MNTIKKRIKLALILAPAIFAGAFWILALSSSPLLESVGLVKLLLCAAFLPFTVAYLITLFIAAMQKEIETEK
jgi:hypothetical protein